MSALHSIQYQDVDAFQSIGMNFPIRFKVFRFHMAASLDALSPEICDYLI
ncbi:hypothetical protein DFP75_101177 [Marinomonas alcarazii]|uniref:Uncharacterized protein n=1 Tax=Marinomonas alcarazii TaxID=491949 RepID=A0A318V5T4_9GAMM|nr:hypothetical protein [Marinomonas alcarazii]PYF84152.1 hypothetical protein DFP75_101177 [Marinomonas alcarazii]